MEKCQTLVVVAHDSELGIWGSIHGLSKPLTPGLAPITYTMLSPTVREVFKFTYHALIIKKCPRVKNKNKIMVR